MVIILKIMSRLVEVMGAEYHILIQHTSFSTQVESAVGMNNHGEEQRRATDQRHSVRNLSPIRGSHNGLVPASVTQLCEFVVRAYR